MRAGLGLPRDWRRLRSSTEWNCRLHVSKAMGAIGSGEPAAEMGATIRLPTGLNLMPYLRLLWMLCAGRENLTLARIA